MTPQEIGYRTYELLMAIDAECPEHREILRQAMEDTLRKHFGGCLCERAKRKMEARVTGPFWKLERNDETNVV